jgi:hypothetical protein
MTTTERSLFVVTNYRLPTTHGTGYAENRPSSAA